MSKKLKSQKEVDTIIENMINISIISKLLKLNLINEREYFLLREKIKSFS